MSGGGPSGQTSVQTVNPQEPVVSPGAVATSRSAVAAVGLGVVLLTVAVFWPATGYDFINFDDPDYVTQNPAVLGGLTIEGASFAFNVGHTGNWIPLTWLSHMLDVSLFGVDPTYHHLHNIVLHAANAGLLLLVLLALRRHVVEGPASWSAILGCGFVATVFAVHPLRLESVVWISERKDLLSALFWMLTLLAYLHHVNRPGWRRMLVVTVLFACGLMAKPMVVSLPVILCILDIWPLNRWNLETLHRARGAILEKLPLFALSAGAAGLTIVAQGRGGAISNAETLPWIVRIQAAFVGYVGYLGDFIWPTQLAIFYPFPQEGWPLPHVLFAVAVFTAVTMLCIVLRNSQPWLAVGWGWYVISALPIIGLIKVGQQASADRYTYLPLIGPLVALVWAASHLRPGKAGNGFRAPVAAAVLIALIGSTQGQIGYWKNSKTLFTRALEVTDRNHIAHYSMSLEYAKEDDLGRALTHGHQAVWFYPQFYEAYLHLAELYVRRQEYDKTRFFVGLAMHQQPDSASAHLTLGKGLLAEQRPLEAIQAFEEALSKSPQLAEAHYNLGVAKEIVGDGEAALEDYTEAIRYSPNHFNSLVSGGRLQLEYGQPALAQRNLSRAAALRPGEPFTLGLLARARTELGDIEGAETIYRGLVEWDPKGAQQLREYIDAATAGTKE